MRLFFGLPLSDNVRLRVEDYMCRLRKTSQHGKIRWVRPENLHVTLRFLGDVDVGARQAVPLLKGWTEAVSVCTAIPVTLGPLGSFPRILYLKVSPAGPVQELYRRLENFLSRIGFEKDIRPFTPHLTLARMGPHSHSKSARTAPDEFHVMDNLNNVVL